MKSLVHPTEKLRASGNTIEILSPRTITSQRKIATGSRTYIVSFFINGETPSNLTLAFGKKASTV